VTEQSMPATTIGDVPVATGQRSRPEIRWAYRGCLILLLITPFLSWFSMWAPEGWGDHADHFGISAGLTVLILLPTLAALATAFIEAVVPVAGLVSVSASVVSLLAILLAIAAGRPSLKQFQDVPGVGDAITSSIQIQLIAGGWIALVLAVAAVTLGTILNWSRLLRVLNLEQQMAKARSAVETASPHFQKGIATAGDALGRASQRKPWLKPAAIGLAAFLVALILWTTLSAVFHGGGRTATQNQNASVPDFSPPKPISVADARQEFLVKAKNMGGADSVLAARAVQMVEQEKLIPRIGWGSVDEMMDQATPETQASYQQWRQATIAQ
jgi:hypothetical protein